MLRRHEGHPHRPAGGRDASCAWGRPRPRRSGPGAVRIRVAASCRQPRGPAPAAGHVPAAARCVGDPGPRVCRERSRSSPRACPAGRLGDRVMALLPGGGYAEEAVVDAGSLLPVPDGARPRAGGGGARGLPHGLPQRLPARRPPGEGGSVLVHGGGSGIGTACIQLARAAGARVIVTAGSDEKCERCRVLGADLAVNYRSGDFRAAVEGVHGGAGGGRGPRLHRGPLPGRQPGLSEPSAGAWC